MSSAGAAAASRVLRRHGALASFQRYVRTKDVASGTATVVAAGDPVEARAAVLDLARSVERGIPAGTQAIIVEGAPFNAAGELLTTDHRVTFADGTVRLIDGSPVISRTHPADPPAYFEARLRTGEAS